LTYIALYAPVLIYSVILSIIGFQRGFSENAFFVIAFQVVSIFLSVLFVFYRHNSWIDKISFHSVSLGLRKPFLLYVLYYLSIEKKVVLLVIKALSLSLLYIVLVWNKGKYDNDSFMLFYLVILMAHAAVPYLAVSFLETNLTICRNVPLSLFKRAAVYIIPYFILLLPELAYILFQADGLPVEHRITYFLNIVTTLFLLTAILYSETAGRDDYIKASFGLFFLSIFALHIQAFWIWIGIQVTISSILFTNGYYKYESAE